MASPYLRKQGGAGKAISLQQKGQYPGYRGTGICDHHRTALDECGKGGLRGRRDLGVALKARGPMGDCEPDCAASCQRLPLRWGHGMAPAPKTSDADAFVPDIRSRCSGAASVHHRRLEGALQGDPAQPPAHTPIQQITPSKDSVIPPRCISRLVGAAMVLILARRRFFPSDERQSSRRATTLRHQSKAMRPFERLTACT
jgi:hypothetical protein